MTNTKRSKRRDLYLDPLYITKGKTTPKLTDFRQDWAKRIFLYIVFFIVYFVSCGLNWSAIKTQIGGRGRHKNQFVFPLERTMLSPSFTDFLDLLKQKFRISLTWLKNSWISLTKKEIFFDVYLTVGTMPWFNIARQTINIIYWFCYVDNLTNIPGAVYF